MEKYTRAPISREARFAIFDRDGFRCVYCGAEAPDATLHIDHILPVSMGGGDDDDNLATACSSCNMGKKARLLESAIPALTPPPRPPSADWFMHTNDEEKTLYMQLSREVQLIEASNAKLLAERRKIMHRAIRRMRRREGKK